MRIPIRLIPHGVIPRDPAMVFRMARTPAGAAGVVAVPAVATLPYLDNFNGSGSLAGRRSDSGYSYGSSETSAEVSGGALRMLTAGNNLWVKIMPPFPTADGYVELTFISDGWATYDNGTVGCVLRDQGGGSYYVAFVYAPSAVRGNFYSYYASKFVAGVETIFFDSLPIAAVIAENVPVVVRFSAVGSTLVLVINGVEIFSITDSDIPGAGATQWYFQSGDPDPGQNHIALLTARADSL